MSVPNWKYQKLYSLISEYMEAQSNSDFATMITKKIEINGMLKSIAYPQSFDEILAEFQGNGESQNPNQEKGSIESIQAPKEAKKCIVCGNEISIGYGEDGLKCSRECKRKYNNSLRKK